MRKAIAPQTMLLGDKRARFLVASRQRRGSLRRTGRSEKAGCIECRLAIPRLQQASPCAGPQIQHAQAAPNAPCQRVFGTSEQVERIDRCSRLSTARIAGVLGQGISELRTAHVKTPVFKCPLNKATPTRVRNGNAHSRGRKLLPAPSHSVLHIARNAVELVFGAAPLDKRSPGSRQSGGAISKRGLGSWQGGSVITTRGVRSGPAQTSPVHRGARTRRRPITQAPASRVVIRTHCRLHRAKLRGRQAGAFKVLQQEQTLDIGRKAAARQAKRGELQRTPCGGTSRSRRQKPPDYLMRLAVFLHLGLHRGNLGGTHAIALHTMAPNPSRMSLNYGRAPLVCQRHSLLSPSSCDATLPSIRSSSSCLLWMSSFW